MQLRGLDDARAAGERLADRRLDLGRRRRAADRLADFVPVTRARAMPLFTRSTIIDLSNSANTPIIWNIALPAGVVVSMPC